MSLATATHYNKAGSYYLAAGSTVVVPDVIASTINTQEIAVGDGRSGVTIFSPDSNSIVEGLVSVIPGNNNIVQSVQNSNFSTIVSVKSGFDSNSTDYGITYATRTAGGSAVTKGYINFLSSVNGSTGGVQIYGQAGEFVSLAATNASLGNATGNNGVTVTPTFISINAGAAGRPIQLQQGYLDVNNLALSNVSTINGQKYPPGPAGFVQFINPASPIQVSTIANAATAVGIAYFSTISTHFYRVTCEFGASNLGGGGATDSTGLAIDSDNSAVIEFIDSWNVTQTYPPAGYQTTASGIMEAAGNWMGLVALNTTASGNTENVVAYRAWAEDLGIPTNQF